MTLMRCLVESESRRGCPTSVGDNGGSANRRLELICKNRGADVQHGDKRKQKEQTRGRERLWNGLAIVRCSWQPWWRGRSENYRRERC